MENSTQSINDKLAEIDEQDTQLKAIIRKVAEYYADTTHPAGYSKAAHNGTVAGYTQGAYDVFNLIQLCISRDNFTILMTAFKGIANIRKH